MNIDVATFKLFLPSFKSTNDAYIQLHLDAASRVCVEDVYGDLMAEAVFYYAAHRMALEPSGMNARLDKTTSATTYGEHWKRIALSVGAAGWRVT